MKNIVLSFFVMMTLFAILFIFASCGNSGVENPADNQNETEVTLVSSAFYSSEFVSLPNKTEYLLNETFDATGLELKFVYEDTYSDQTTKLRTLNITYPDENLEFTVPDFSTLGEKWITVVYNDGDYFPDFSFTVWVKENISSSDPVDPDPENPTVMYTSLDSISIKTLPTKTEYKVNEEFDPTGLEITAIYTNYYSDNSTMSYLNDISYDNNMTFSGTDFSTAGTKTITVTYTENETSKSATFEITVKAAAFSSIINYTTFDSEINSDLSIYNGKAMTLYLDTTTVNIATLYTQFATLLDAVKAGSVKVDFADAGKTTIEGELYMNNHLNMNAVNENRYANIKSFVNAIKSSVLNSDSYPTMNMQMTSRTMSDATPFNLYHTDIADLLNLYFNNYMGDKISSFSVSSSAEFDAVDYLNANGGIAYDANGDYTGNYYNLNVNAALLMNGTALKNVNVTGELKDDFVVTSTVTNTRFNFSNPNSNSNKFEFAENVAGIGLIEFAGDAPSVLPNTDKAKIIISNTDNTNDDILLYGGAVIDFSKLSSLDDNTGPNFISGGGVYYEHAYFKNENAFNNFKSKGGAVTGAVYYTEDGTSSIPNYKTNQQWIDAANANNGEGDFVQGNGNVFFPSPAISKLNLDEKNNNKLLNTILFYNQKVYG